MDDKLIIDARKKAEKAVEGMSDPSLKLKAFEQIFARLLDSAGVGESSSARRTAAPPRKPVRAPGTPGQAASLTDRLLVLRGDGFFGSQRTLTDIREELGSRGWHYPLTTLSGAMQNLVRNRELRRERVKNGNRRTWRYANA